MGDWPEHGEKPWDDKLKGYIDDVDEAIDARVDSLEAGGIADGDKGDITVSGGGADFAIDTGAVSSAEIADGTIVNADISASAAIDVTKLAQPALLELMRDTIAAALVQGTNVTITPNDGADTITISAAGTDAEVVRDTIASALVAGTNVTITPNDGADTITIAATGGSTDAEIVRDTIAAALVAGTNVTITPNDGADTITIAATTGGVSDGDKGDVIVSGSGTVYKITPRMGIIRVASSQAPQDVKDQCDYVCTGTNDQTVINTALLAASRTADGFGGISAGCVELVGGDFFTSQNGTTTITMYPATWLRGSGPGVMLQGRWPTNTPGRGAIELLNTATAHVRVSDLTIGRPDATAMNGGGIYFTNNATATTYDNNTGGDPFIMIDNVTILKPREKSIYVTGTSGGARETQIVNCHGYDGVGIVFDIDSSDCKLTACTAQAGSGGPGFAINGGNAKLVNCKSYYAEANLDGFLVASSRAELVGCAAQDNGRWGFNITSTDATVVGCVADSNARLTAGGGGFQIASSGVYEGLHCFDRGQTPGSPQLQGIVFSGSPQVFVTGRVSVPSGSAHVVNAPGSNSYVRVVRNGTTLHSVG